MAALPRVCPVLIRPPETLVLRPWHVPSIETRALRAFGTDFPATRSALMAARVRRAGGERAALEWPPSDTRSAREGHKSGARAANDGSNETERLRSNVWIRDRRKRRRGGRKPMHTHDHRVPMARIPCLGSHLGISPSGRPQEVHKGSPGRGPKSRRSLGNALRKCRPIGRKAMLPARFAERQPILGSRGPPKADSLTPATPMFPSLPRQYRSGFPGDPSCGLRALRNDPPMHLPQRRPRAEFPTHAPAVGQLSVAPHKLPTRAWRSVLQI